jgi:hypothetical protein
MRGKMAFLVIKKPGSSCMQRWYAFGSGPNETLSQVNVAAVTRATFIPDTQDSVIGSGTASFRERDLRAHTGKAQVAQLLYGLWSASSWE